MTASNRPDHVASGRRRWLGLGMLSLGVAMIIVDATIVNVAVPSIARDLGLSGTGTEWVNSIYALVFAAFLVTMGRFGDRIGRRKMYLGGLGLFLFASVLAGFAPSGEALIAARVLQGLGGAAILPATQSILNSGFRGRDRAIAFGIWGSVIGGVAALGPLIGGWLTTYLSWRWAFYVNIPWGLLAIAGTYMWVDESCDENAKGGFDPFGFVFVTLGLTAVVFSLIEGYTYGWTAPSQKFSMFGLTWPLDSISIIPFAFARRRLPPGIRRRGDKARASRQVLPVRLWTLEVPGLPLWQPGRHDCFARRIRAAVRAAALPAGRYRPVRLPGRSDRACVGGGFVLCGSNRGRPGEPVRAAASGHLGNGV